MINSKKILAILVGALAFVTMAPALSAEVIWRAGLGTSADHPLTISTRKFAELVFEKTDGRIEIQVFDSGQLGSNELDALRTGTLQVAVSTPSQMAQFDPAFAILELPYIFQSFEHMVAVTTGDVGRQLVDRYEDSADIVILSFFGGAQRNMITVGSPLNSIDDLAGRKMRTFQSDTMINWWADLGAIGAVIPFGEVYPALQTGVIDGAENEFTTFTTARWAEVAKYIALTEHSYTVRPLLVSKSAFDALSTELQDAVREAGIEAAQFDLALEQRLDLENLDRLKSDFNVTVTSPDKAPFIERSARTLDKFANENSVQELLEQIRAAAE